MSSQASKPCDAIRINDLHLIVPLLTGAHWSQEDAKPVEQPITVTLAIFCDLSRAAKSDNLSHSLNYAEIAERIRTSTGTESFVSIQHLSRHVLDTVADMLVNFSDDTEVWVRTVQLKAPLHTKALAVEHTVRFASGGSLASRVTHFVEGLVCPTIVGINSAERLEKQDVVVNVSIDTVPLDECVDLRFVTKELYKEITTSKFDTLEALTSLVVARVLSVLKSCQKSPVVSVRVAKPSALVFASSAEVQIQRTFDDYPDEFRDPLSHPETIEMATCPEEISKKPTSYTAAIALGSNLGDSFHNIEYALRLLEKPEHIFQDGSGSFVEVVDTSFLYETAPMYVTDQPSFVNCACMIETNLPPMALLRILKGIELKVGRVPSIRNGPRAVDLDIIFYDDSVFDTRDDKTDIENLDGELVIPHPRVQEREFVLRPLHDMIPDYTHPVLKKTVTTLFQAIYDPRGPPMKKVIPFPHTSLVNSAESPHLMASTAPSTQCVWSYTSNDFITNSPSTHTTDKRRTHIMATLNVTPDSFSDGALNNELQAALSYVSSSVLAGASIVDIGGYSTRPGAAFVSVDDEIARVVPVIQAMRDRDFIYTYKTKQLASDADPLTTSSQTHINDIINVPISIDTFRWEVAEAAIQSGANCINDVYAFTGPDFSPLASSGTEGDKATSYMVGMKAVARKYAVPVVLMHSRGDAGENKDYSEYDYAIDTQGRGAVLEGVRIELGVKVDMIVKGRGGIRRWLVIIDPGVGFSKTLEGNLEVLRAAKEIVADISIGAPNGRLYRNPLCGYPQLIGASRKSFLGVILAKGHEGRETVPKERNFATAAAVACAVQQAALLIRVHDVKEMMDVVKVAEALYI